MRHALIGTYGHDYVLAGKSGAGLRIRSFIVAKSSVIELILEPWHSLAQSVCVGSLRITVRHDFAWTNHTSIGMHNT